MVSSVTLVLLVRISISCSHGKDHFPDGFLAPTKAPDRVHLVSVTSQNCLPKNMEKEKQTVRATCSI